MAFSYSIGYQASRSGQAHRWNGAAGAWERYGNLRDSHPIVHTAIYDEKRNRIVVFESQGTSIVHVIAAKDPSATWSKIAIPWFTHGELYQSVGYHAALDCFVLVDQHRSPNRVWVMDPDQISVGWKEVAVQGSAARPMAWAGLEYVPPMQAFASANTEEANALYYLAPTAGRFGAWAWYKEVFTGTTTPAAWSAGSAGLDSPQSRVKWSSLLNALVMLKTPTSPTEIFTPSTLANK